MIGTIHASCVMLAAAGQPFGTPAGAGVLLLGESGSGKSETALRLIERGARLVSDDRTELFMNEGRLAARAPNTLQGLLEIRGVGIVALPPVRQANVALAVELVAPEGVRRLPEPAYYAPPATLGGPRELRVPLLHLSLTAATPVKIIAAAALLARADAQAASQIS